MKRNSIQQIALIAIVAFPAITFCGCDGAKTATVSGTVTFRDKPVTGGTIMFLSEDQTKQQSATIKADGTYTAANVPWGKVQVGVRPVGKQMTEIIKGAKDTSKPPKDTSFARSSAPEGQYVDIPEPLRNPATSNITLDIDSSPKTFDVKLVAHKL